MPHDRGNRSITIVLPAGLEFPRMKLSFSGATKKIIKLAGMRNVPAAVG